MNTFIDETEWPIVVVHWEGPLAQVELRAFLARLDIWLERGERFGLLIDSRAAQGMSPEQRVQVVQHMKERASLTSRWLVQAIVLQSLIQRTLFYGINLLFPNPFPSQVFATPEPACAWLEATLAESR